jgi:DNA polymerase III delta prime subunit
MVTTKEHTIFVEKYRPKTLDNYICDEQIREKIQEFITNQDIPHLGFFGLQGSGKSTLAKILVNSIDCDFIYLNATENRGMDDIKEKVGSFASARGFKPLKIVILDESTHILQASQVLLLNMIETYSLTTRFILTGNYPERLIPPLRSRLQEFKLTPPSKKVVAKHVYGILNQENIEFQLEDLAAVVNSSYPDFRKIINDCQKYIIDNKLTLPNTLGKNEDVQSKILDELKKPTTKTFNNIRQIIADNDVSSFEDVFKHLYECTNDYAVGCEGQIAVIINECIYQSNFRVDLEINFMACISRIIETIKTNRII